MIFETWLNDIRLKYDVNIEHIAGNSQFIADVYHFSDPNALGLGFEISVNDDSQASIFNTADYPFTRFNIAEYISSKDIITAAELCLSGDLDIRRTFFGHKKLVFSLGGVSVWSKAVNGSAPTPEGYHLRLDTK